MTEAISAKERLLWVDVLKGIGIVCVVAGHIAPPSISVPIYLFHMPLFFITAGFLFNQHRISDYITKKAKQLLVPYACYGTLLLLLPAIAMDLWHQKSFMVASTDLAAAFGRFAYGGRSLKGVFGAFWFVTCLFLTQIIYDATEKRLSTQWMSFLAGCCLALSYLYDLFFPEMLVPWNANVVLFSLPLFHVGHMARKVRWFESPGKVYRYVPHLLTITLVALISIKIGFISRMDMKYAMFSTPILGFSFSVAIVGFMAAVAISISGSKVSGLFVSLGRASLTIMFLHQLVHFTFDNSYTIGFL